MRKIKAKVNKKKKIVHQNHKARQQITGVVLIVVAVLLLLGMFNLAGVGGEFLSLIFKILLGRATWGVPVCLLVISFFYFAYNKVSEKSHIFSFKARIVALFLMVLILSGLAHINFINDKTSFQLHNGGGYIGFGLSYIMLNTFGNIATWVIFIGFLIVLAIIVLTGLIKFDFKKRKDRSTENHQQQKLIDDVSNKKQPISSIKKKLKPKLFSINKKQEFSEINVEQSKKTFSNKKIDLPLDLLDGSLSRPNAGDTDENKLIIENTLQNFSIPVQMGETKTGPTVTQYTFKPAEGIKLSKITTLQDDLAMALAVHPIRIEAPIPGRSLVGVEVPNNKIAVVRLKQMLDSKEFKNSQSNFTISLGMDVSGDVWLRDFDKMPHLLIAGATGSGKTIFLNAIIISLLYQNSIEDLRFILIDPKKVELTLYNTLPHLLTPVITDPDKAVSSLRWAITEMDRRFEVLSKAKKRDISSYNKYAEEKLPNIIIIIDELADLMALVPQELESCIVRLTQMARAVGIHLILATQRPSVNVITGIIKANITNRIAFSVASLIDSRTILDFSGAEKLLGRGDALFISSELSKPKRIQAAYVSDQEVKKVVSYLTEKLDQSYDEEVIKELAQETTDGFSDLKQDELLPEAEEIIIQAGKASASYLQRRLRIGYARAARILDLLEEKGIIGPADGAKPRKVYKSFEENSETEDTEEADNQ